MLSLKVFGQRDVDVKAAHQRFNGIAKRITERFDDLPRIATKLITKASFDELRQHPEILIKFPTNVKSALTRYDSYNVFNVVRTMGSLEAPDELLMAYMISEKQLEEIMPTVSGSIVPVDQVNDVFVSGEPLCSHNVADEIHKIQQQIAELQKKLDGRLMDLDLDQQQAFNVIETNLKTEIRDVGQAMRAWPMLINSFSYTRDFALSMQDNSVEKGIAANITFLGNAIYQTALSRELIMMDAIYKPLPLGSIDWNIPTDITALASLTNNATDPLVVFGTNSATFHTLVGRRWMLLNLSMTELFTESQTLDAFLDMLFDDINRRVGNQKLNALFKDTFPKNLIFHLIKGYTNSSEIEALKANLFAVIRAYFELSPSVLIAVEKIKTWWKMKITDIFEKSLRDDVRTHLMNIGRYIAATQELAGTYDLIGTYKSFFTQEYSFSDTVVALFALLKSLSGVSLWTFNPSTITTPYALNNALSNTQDFNYAQETIFKNRLKDMIDLVNTDIQTTTNSLLMKIYTDVRSFLSFARNFVKSIDSMLISQGLIDIRSVSSNDEILLSLVGNEGLPKYAFFALSYFWEISNVSVVDAIKNYFAHVYLYRLYKLTRVVDNLDANNRFTPFLTNLQMRFDSNEQIDLAVIFDNAATSVFSDWNGFEFENAVQALNPFQPLTAAEAPEYDKIVIQNQPIFNSSVMSSNIGKVIEQDPTLGTPVVPSRNNITPNKMTDAIDSVFGTLDTILGGDVSSSGDVVLLDTFLFDIDNKKHISIYLAALWIFTKSTRKDTRYANWSTMDLWMYIIDHIKNHKDTTAMLGFQWSDFNAINTIDTTASNFTGKFDVSMFFPNFVQQRIIDVDTTTEQSLDSILLGKNEYYADFKLNVWNSLPQYMHELIYCWLIPSQYQRHCAIHRAETPYVWINLKRALLLLSDDEIAATLYAGFVSGSITPSQFFSFEPYSVFSTMIQTKMTFAEGIFRDTLWKNLPFYEIGKNALPSKDLTVDSFGKSLRAYNEFLLIHRQHTAQQYNVAFYLTKNSAFPAGLFYKSKLHMQSILNKQKIKISDEQSGVTPSILRSIFDPVFNKGIDGISEPLRSIIDNPETTLEQLELFLYVIVCAGVESSTNIAAAKLHTITPLSDVTAWDVRFSLMFRELDKNNSAATSSSASSSQSTIRKFARQVSIALFNASSDVKTAFVEAVKSYQAQVVDLLVPEEESIYINTNVSYPDARVALDAVFDTYYEIATASIYTMADHNLARNIFQTPYEVLDVEILHSNNTDVFAVERIAFLKKLILHLELGELDEYEQELQSAPNYYKNWFGESVLSKAFKKESWRERAMEFFQNVIIATTYTIQTVSETKRNVRSLVIELNSHYYSPSVIFKAINLAQNPDLFFIYTITGTKLKQIEVETPEFNLASLIVIALNNSGLLKTNIAGVTTYRSAAMPPPLFAISYILRTFSGFCAIATHTGLQRFSAREIRLNPTVERTYNEVKNQLEFLNDVDALTIDRLIVAFTQVNTMLNQLPRYHPVTVIWCLALERMARNLETQETSDDIQQEWTGYLQNVTNVQKETTLSSYLGVLCLRWVSANIFAELDRAVTASTSEDDKFNHYSVFTANNPLLTGYGIHHQLTLAIVNEK